MLQGCLPFLDGAGAFFKFQLLHHSKKGSGSETLLEIKSKICGEYNAAEAAIRYRQQGSNQSEISARN